MTSFPFRSDGVLLAGVGPVIVAYDLVDEAVHLLNGPAGLVLGACDGSSAIDRTVTEWAAEFDESADRVAQDVQRALAQLATLGLVGRTAPVPVATAFRGSDGPPFGHLGAVHAVLDDGIQFRSPQPSLLAEIDRHLGTADPARPATIHFDVSEDDDGVVRLSTEFNWTFPTRRGCLDQLPTIVNEYAIQSATLTVLHAGAVRSPDGGVLVLGAPSGAGKSTLTAAMVQHGWDYLSDEAVGIRPRGLQAVAYPKPLALDATSRSLLGLSAEPGPNTPLTELRADATGLRGEAGRVTRVVLPRFEPGAETSLTELDPPQAILALLELATNLRHVGQEGLDTLCMLAESVPVHRLVHSGFDQAIPVIQSGQTAPPIVE